MEASCRVAGRPVECTHLDNRNQNELLAMAYQLIASVAPIPNGPEFAVVLTVPDDSSKSISTERKS